MEKQFWIYILTNRPKGVLYTGLTNDIVRRVAEHQRGEGDTFAAKYKLKHLVLLESFDSFGAAVSREKELKQWPRNRKIALIERSNPRWRVFNLEAIFSGKGRRFL